MTVSAQENQDPYTAKAASSASTQTKIDEVVAIIGAVKTGMLTTRSASGVLHARAMAPASKAGLEFVFFANTESGKTDEIDDDGAANISFFDPSSTDWVSVSGKAVTSQDREKIKELWNPATKAWFGDLGDGKHTGDETDPRVCLITVTPSEIRYWKTTTGKVGQAIEIAKGAITGNVAAPGNLRILSSSELETARSMAK